MADFQELKEKFQRLFESAFENRSVSQLIEAYTSLKLSDADKRLVVDQALKDHLLLLTTKTDLKTNVFEGFILFTVELRRNDMCSPTTPVILLSDIFEVLTLNRCEELFAFVEQNVDVWKQDLFFSVCKNNLLRMCNDLLRRLSRSQNTVFRGRILLFLAKFFPFSERSGLNVVSEFNLDNVAGYSLEDKSSNFDEPMDQEEEESEKRIKMDYNLYHKFLSIQDFFRSPNHCYNKLKWRIFVNSTTDILTAFNNFKIDNDAVALNTPTELVTGQAHEVFFAKYLTNPKLLELQLSDANFRRSLLVQLLLTFQYLTASVKFKTDALELKPDQCEWVKEQTNFVYKLLTETPKNSKKFAESVRHILNREELWNNWKNEGCPEFKPPTAVDDDLQRPRKIRNKNLGDLIKEANEKGQYYMGNAELTRLWNLHPKNLEACKTSKREFLPSIDSYFEESMMQLCPSSQVEDEYKKVNDGNFGWRALRLLAQRSPCFFTFSNTHIAKLPVYLETCLRKIARDKPLMVNGGEVKTEEVDDLLNEDKEQVNINAEEVQTNTANKVKISKETLEKIATLLGDLWYKLAGKLCYQIPEVTPLNSVMSDYEKALEMLTTWVNTDEDASPEMLEYFLEGLNFMEAAKVLQTAVLTE